MADKKYRIRDEVTGKVHVFMGPEDATDAEIEDYIKSQAPKPEETKPVTGSVQSPKSSYETIKNKQSATDILGDVGVGMMKPAVNLGTRVVDLATTPGRLLTKALGAVAPKAAEPYSNALQSSADAMERARNWWQSEYETAGPAAGVGALATDIAATGGVTAPVNRAVTAAIPRIAGETAKRALNRATVTGATSGAISGAMTADDPTTGATVGGITGGLFPRVLSRLTVGGSKSAPARALIDEDVPLTVGQAAERDFGGRISSGIESGGKLLPFTGQAIENQQQRAVRGWRDAALRRTTIPETSHGPAVRPGTTLEGTTQADDVIAGQRRAFEQRYGQATQGAEFIPDEQLERRLLDILNDPERLLDERGRQQVQDAYNRVVQGRIRSRPIVEPDLGQVPTREGPPTSMSTEVAVPGRGVQASRGGAIEPAGTPPPGFNEPLQRPRPGTAYWTGQDLMQARRTLNRYGHRLIANNDPYREATGSALRDLSDEILNLMTRQNEPVGYTIQALRAPYSAFRTIEDAAAAGAGRGSFTPAQLRRFAERSSNDELERLARNAEEVFHSTRTSPRESGETDLRGLVRWLTGGAALAHDPTYLLSTAAGRLAYTPTGQRLALGQTRGQRAFAEYLRRQGMGDIVGGQ